MHKSRVKFLKIDFFFIYKNTIITMTTKAAVKKVKKAPHTKATWLDVMEFNWEPTFYYLNEDDYDECLFQGSWIANPFNILDNKEEELHAYMDGLDSHQGYQDWYEEIQEYMIENELDEYTKSIPFSYVLRVEGWRIDKRCCNGRAVFKFEGCDLVDILYEIENIGL